MTVNASLPLVDRFAAQEHLVDSLAEAFLLRLAHIAIAEYGTSGASI